MTLAEALADGAGLPDGTGLRRRRGRTPTGQPTHWRRAEPEGAGEADGAGVLRANVSTNPIGSVRIRRKSSEVVWTVESP